MTSVSDDRESKTAGSKHCEGTAASDPDFLAAQGVRALGSRVRRLFERMNGAVTELYRERTGFEQRWFALSSLLYDSGPTDSAGAARALRQTHTAIAHAASAMEKAGLLQRVPNPSDRRSKVLSLTPEGLEVFAEVRRLSLVVERAASEMLAAHAPGFMGALDALDHALDEEAYGQRIARHMKSLSD